ncbi:MAG: 23S rRNA (adenine(2503)-C(2))-methyltransferase RlmN [bacterium]|jgi:23S rRNA (adenine2503-C2)-methyltransferase
MKNILNLSKKELEEYCAVNGFKKYGAEQIMRWIYQNRIFDFSVMSDISKDLRKKIDEDFYVKLPDIIDVRYEKDEDGYSKKYLIKFENGDTVESVSIAHKNRKTLCVSSQVGCRMGCVYCETAGMGFSRNLTSGEIISQLLTVENYENDKITNIVFMGMGEPLDNIAEVEKALEIMSNDKFVGIAPRKITVSTCGLINALGGFDINGYKYKLAISLNAADNETRSMLMPVNKKFPIEKIAELINLKKPSLHNKITLEYVLIKGLNDRIEDAKRIIKLFSPSKVKINLITLNKAEDSVYLKNFERPDDFATDKFKIKLSKAGFTVTVRFSKGGSINGGCGQLKAQTLKY